MCVCVCTRTHAFTRVCVSVSEAPAEAPKPQKYESFNVDTFKSDEQKKDEVRLLAGLLYALTLSRMH